MTRVGHCPAFNDQTELQLLARYLIVLFCFHDVKGRCYGIYFDFVRSKLFTPRIDSDAVPLLRDALNGHAVLVKTLKGDDDEVGFPIDAL